MYDRFEEIEQDMTEEEIEEMMDGLILPLAEHCQEEDDENAVLNFEKTKSLMYTYKILKYLTKGTKVKVTYEINEPYRSMGSVSLIGKDLIFKNPEWFMVAVRLASNFNVYPRTDGTVRMDFTFHGMTTPIK